ncbi:ogr/Delta-like zinc finger family protein [Novosphingobium sp. ST904]|uniref:ogr/Delta-like zinc finger family protein n=1 Tax=Novosphingobium sp. ST904 TaxID=1684385 RepID=UPI0006C88B36|nr:ogr/Delta-like zinc finger family protein [Novosphingobium sp. ST904]KPH62313.1 hypothetical protein ADT71_15340 [Novosphingobium sp. ST904]TCM43349.1 Ogr/Delta-like zinc finger protein [Novosphingobium sp. ST904]
MSGEGILHGKPLIYAPLEFRLRSGGAPAKDSALIICPVCEAPAFIRRSVRHTPTVKHIHCHCTNTGCGMTYMAEIAFVHTFNPSLIRREGLDLPQCPSDQIPQVLPPTRDSSDGDPDQLSMFGT